MDNADKMYENSDKSIQHKKKVVRVISLLNDINEELILNKYDECLKNIIRKPSIWLDWNDCIPILEFLCYSGSITLYDELLEYNKFFGILEVSDLNKRLKFLEGRGLIKIIGKKIILKWMKLEE